jgi:tetratricopeptide (TPR) repeat protein
LVASLTNLAALRLRQQRGSESEKLYLRAMGILDEKGEVDSPEGMAVLCGLAELSAARGRHEEAEQYARRALSNIGRPGEFGERRGVALMLLGAALRAQGRLQEAESFVRQAIASWEMYLGRRHPTAESGKACLAILISDSEPVEAEKLFREALEVFELELGSEHPDTEALRANFARFLRGQGRKKEARSLEQRAGAGRRGSAAPASHSIDLEALRGRRRW